MIGCLILPNRALNPQYDWLSDNDDGDVCADDGDNVYARARVCVCVHVTEQFCVMILSEFSGVCDDLQCCAYLCIIMFIMD